MFFFCLSLIGIFQGCQNTEWNEKLSAEAESEQFHSQGKFG